MMIRLCVFLIVTIFIPLPSDQHFIWPLDMCVLADICNHTWIPECGLERDEDYYRLFLDECDMFEYNCDNKLYFEIRNYSECFGQGPCPPMKCPPTSKCPTHRKAHDGFLFFRRSLDKPTLATPPPNLPYHMLHGKRRYTPNKYKTPLRVEPFPRNILSVLRSQFEKEKREQLTKAKTKRQTTRKRKYKPKPILRSVVKKNVVKTRATRGMTTSISRMLTTASRLITGLTRTMWETKIIKTSIFMKNGRRVIKIYKGINLGYQGTTKEMHTEDSDYLE